MSDYQTILVDRIDLSLDIPAQSMIPDGFAYNTSIRYLPKRYQDYALKNLEWLRGLEAGSMYPRQYPVPLVAGTQIAAYDTYSTQYKTPAGSWLWGWDLTVVSGSAANLYIQITDPCTKKQLWSYYVNASMFTSTSNAKRPRVIPHPKKIDSDGLVEVQLKNNSASPVTLTFAFYTAEPAANLMGTPIPPERMEVI